MLTAKKLRFMIFFIKANFRNLTKMLVFGFHGLHTEAAMRCLSIRAVYEKGCLQKFSNGKLLLTTVSVSSLTY